MYLAIRARHWLAAGAALSMIVFAVPGSAQEIADSHLKAARVAITALTATQEFDNLLPQAAGTLKAELTRKNPDLVKIIGATVDEVTLSLASRRGDLEKEAATIYARTFTEDQLKEITAFYTSESGKKLLVDGAVVARQVVEAAGVWQRGIARDLVETVGKKMEQIVNANAANVQPVPVEEEAPKVNQ